jgi:hypothetical protein
MSSDANPEMQLPNSDSAVVPRAKIVGYLLNPQHPDGSSKAKFFESLGFKVEEWQVLAGTLQQIALSYPVVKNVESSHGQKYFIDGAITSPNGGSAQVRTVWIVDQGEDIPRLVTAYPREIKS